ncbi:MAG: tRNA (N6-isopentenyl adenosine(37)-C2)-methylthiotransferase MiaB [Patescibacteria group bacterium]
MKYYLFIIGCQMNYSDAERLESVLNEMGYKKTYAEKEADIILAVACSVRQKAVDRIYGLANHWLKEKKKRRLITVLTGCVLPYDKNKMKKYFDLILDIKDLSKLPKFLAKYSFNNFNIFNSSAEEKYLRLTPKYTSNYTAYVPIMTGCDNFCRYCAVPFTRGREYSRPQKEIVEEVKKLINKNYKEIVLLGQNVNSYGHKKGRVYIDNKPFILLLKAINAVPGKFWLRFISNHPKDMTGDLIKIIPKLKKITPYIHLPLQAGDDIILKKMNRPYTTKQYLKIVGLIRKNVPGIAISTDIIVGFPGETKKQFKNTLKVAKEAGYDMAYLAQYSPRPGTAAAKLKDDIQKEEKKKREFNLNEVIKKTAFINNKKLLYTFQEILVDGQKNGYYYGRTKTNKVVKFESRKNIIGQFTKVKITKAEPWKLTAEIK